MLGITRRAAKQITDKMGLGVRQNWVDETANRVLGTTYTNTYGKPIYISITGTPLSATNNFNLVIDGVQVLRIAIGLTGSLFPLVGIVKSGGTYNVSGTNMGLSIWAELK